MTNPTHTPDVERVARAIMYCNRDCEPHDGFDGSEVPSPYEMAMARAAIAALSPPVPDGWQLVPKDDASRDFADSALPEAMIEAGEEALERAQNDLTNYVSGETADWDTGMIAVAVYRAMLAASPPVSPPDGLREVLEELRALSEKATPGPWEHMQGLNLVRAIRGDLAIPVLEARAPYGDPLARGPTVRSAGEIVFRKGSKAADEAEAFKREWNNAALAAAAVNYVRTILSAKEEG